jgi:hypothetical protein
MTLRSYQDQIANDAVKLLKAYGIAYLSMQVRTGKTITSLTAAVRYGAKEILFVTKKKAISSILSDHTHIEGGSVLAVVNYEQLHNYDRNPDVIICDEAHCLGAFPKPSVRTKRLKEICKNKPVIFLSGTPTPESYSQIFHQLYVSSFSPFKEYKNFYQWANAGYVNIRKKYLHGMSINDYKQANKHMIDKETKHLFISYTQEQAGFKTEVEDEIIPVKMQPSTYFLADKLRKDRVFTGKNGNVILADTEVKLMNKLHQIYSGTVIDESGDGVAFDNTKIKLIQDLFRNKKIAIFYKFKAEESQLIWAYGYDKLTTDPEVFNQSTDKVFISQIQSGREGINLSTADAIVMLNIDFSAVSYIQARNRLMSKERTSPAKVYWIFAEGGIENEIYAKVQDKQDFTLSYFTQWNQKSNQK